MNNTIEKEQHHHEGHDHVACGCDSGGCGCHSHSYNTASGELDIPVRFQILREGDRVVEFGSGTGNDSLAAAQMTGPAGMVTGIDLSEGNINTANAYKLQLGIANASFIQGNIEATELEMESADVIFSTCVFNLQQNKQKVADEMYRVCDHHGMICVSDFAYLQDVPEGLKKDGGQLAGCIGGMENIRDFMGYFVNTGFENVDIVDMRKVHLPDDIFLKHLTPEETARYKDPSSDEGIFSVTLIAEKPSECNPGSCCCNPDKHK